MNLYKIREEFKEGKTVYDLNLRVTYYARVSTDKYEQLNSLENQVTFFEEMIREKPNWFFVDGYVDEGISGTSTEKRDAFNRMISDGKAGKFDLIVTKEVSRFARDTLDSIKNTRDLLSYGVGVYFINDNINTLEPDSELRLTIMTSLAQDEVRKLSERVKFGYQRSIKNGRVLGNNEIWGYEKKNCKLIIVEEEAKMIRRIFELYCTNKYGMHTIANMLYKEGYKNKNGNALAMTTIANIIKNPKYKGYYCGNKTTVIDYKLKTVITKEKEDWVIYKDYDNVPPIVSEEIWDLANNIYKQRQNKTSHVDKKLYQNRYMFSGKIKCSCHDRSFHRKIYKYKTKDDEIVWLCPYNNMKKEEKCKTPILYEKKLINILRVELTDFISKKESIIYTLTELYKDNISLRNFEHELHKLQSDIEKIKKKKEKLLNHNVNNIITDKEFKEQNDICNDTIKTLEENIDKINQEQEKANNIIEEINKLEALVKKKLKNPSNEMILDLLDKIVVYDTEDKTKVKLKICLKIGKEIDIFYEKEQPYHFHSCYAYDPCRC